MSLKRSLAIATFPLRNACGEILRMRFGILSESRRNYRREILASGLFNAAHYRSQRPRCLVARCMPLRHFILRGERMGLSPSEWFSPGAYLHANPDIRRKAVAPFRHFLEHGRAEKRRQKVARHHRSVIAGIEFPEIRPAPQSTRRPIAVVVHLYYYDLWPELLESIRNLKTPFDLLVTITRQEGFQMMFDQVKRDRPDALVWGFPNHGRDIFPFVHLLNSGRLDGYLAVCKLHTKKSLHRADGDAWRSHLTGSILPPDGQADRLVARILADPEAGLIVADGQISAGEKFWGSNRKRSQELLDDLGIDAAAQPLRFPLGSIFWVTRPVIRILRKLDLKPWQFEPEHAQLDGTLAHTIERVLGIIALANGLRVDQCSDLMAGNPPEIDKRP